MATQFQPTILSTSKLSAPKKQEDFLGTRRSRGNTSYMWRGLCTSWSIAAPRLSPPCRCQVAWDGAGAGLRAEDGKHKGQGKPPKWLSFENDYDSYINKYIMYIYICLYINRNICIVFVFAFAFACVFVFVLYCVVYCVFYVCHVCYVCYVRYVCFICYICYVIYMVCLWWMACYVCILWSIYVCIVLYCTVFVFVLYCNVMYVQIVGIIIEFGGSRLMRQPVPTGPNPPHLAECIPLTVMREVKGWKQRWTQRASTLW